MIEKKIKHIFYVDGADNTKDTICAFEEHIDLRHKECIEVITEKVKEVFQGNVFMTEHAKDIAEQVAYCDYTTIDQYDFGVEEITLFEC
jgi:hypothetical protein